MYVCMHLYMCVCIYTCVCVCIQVYMFLSVCVSMYACVCIYVCKCVYVYMYRYVCMCVSTCGLVCICFQEKELLLWECIVAKIFLFLNNLRCRLSPGAFLVDVAHGCSSCHSKGLLGRTSFTTLCLFLAKGS